MSISLGLDVGAVSVKLAALGAPEDYPVLAHLAEVSASFFLPKLPKSNRLSERPVVLSTYRRLQGNPLQAASDLLHEFRCSRHWRLHDAGHACCIAARKA